METLHGIGLTNKNVFSKNSKLPSLLKQLTIPNTKHPFFVTVEASLIGFNAVPFQLNEEDKTKLISYNSRILNITIHMPQRTSKILLVRLTANDNALIF